MTETEKQEAEKKETDLQERIESGVSPELKAFKNKLQDEGKLIFCKMTF